MKPAESEERLHALRNAINAAIMSAQVVRRHLLNGACPQALNFLDGVDHACERLRLLIETESVRSDYPIPLNDA